MKRITFAATAALAAVMAVIDRTAAGEPRPNLLTFANTAGVHRIVSTTGPIDGSNPFFQDLGTNGRTCFTCHRPAQGWTITPEEVQERFDRTDGLEPIFRRNDGSNYESADLSTIDSRKDAFSLLLSRALIRVVLKVPMDAEFDIVEVDDPYSCGALLDEPALYRRPLPSTNLRFLSTVMWDGRETVEGDAIRANLMRQASNATTGHAQGAPPTPAELAAIVDFELSLFTAQAQGRDAGDLAAQGALGGPEALSMQPFCIGINDPFGSVPAVPGACETQPGGHDPNVFTLFGAWQHAGNPERQAIARGEQIFNTKTFVVDNVGGLNGGPHDPVAGPIAGGTCTLCHNTPNAGDHSISLPLNIGLADESNRTPDLPLYTLMNQTSREIVKTTDPGRAMVTGRWADIGKFKGPILRALAARAPYFHNGAAANLEQVVEFYDKRFKIGLTPREKADLVAFLSAL